MIYDGINDNAFTGNILIEDGVIKKVSKSSIQGDTIIDAEGKIVTPGFIASDTEIGIVEIGALSVTRDDQSSIYSIGFSIHDAFNPNSTLIPWNRSNGITSAITLPRNTSSPIGGLGSFFSLNGALTLFTQYLIFSRDFGIDSINFFMLFLFNQDIVVAFVKKFLCKIIIL